MIFLDSIGTYLISNENLDEKTFFIMEKLGSEVERKKKFLRIPVVFGRLSLYWLVVVL